MRLDRESCMEILKISELCVFFVGIGCFGRGKVGENSENNGIMCIFREFARFWWTVDGFMVVFSGFWWFF